ncbi:unnamed protein product, partial [Didymodactylos carnosus]
DGWLLGDTGYASKSWLLTPIKDPATSSQRRYNRAFKRCRCTIERLFGV